MDITALIEQINALAGNENAEIPEPARAALYGACRNLADKIENPIEKLIRVMFGVGLYNAYCEARYTTKLTPSRAAMPRSLDWHLTWNLWTWP